MKKILPFLIFLSAIIISVISGYYSIIGLSKLFSGANLSVIIMAFGFEISKLVIAIALHEYWNKFKVLLKIYLISATIVLVGITSLGIYGYLSAAFQNTYNIEIIASREIQMYEDKKEMFSTQLNDYISERDNTMNSISELRSALSGNVIQYIDRETGNLITTTSAANRRSFESQLSDALDRRDNLMYSIQSLNDSISKYNFKIIELRNASDQTTDLATLQFIAEVTNLDINRIVHYFILVIIFVFDPLALTLVVTATYTYSLYRNNNKKINEEETNKKVEDNPTEEVEDEVDKRIEALRKKKS